MIRQAFALTLCMGSLACATGPEESQMPSPQALPLADSPAPHQQGHSVMASDSDGRGVIEERQERRHITPPRPHQSKDSDQSTRARTTEPKTEETQ